MTQLVGALVSVHDALALLTNLDSLPDPPRSSVRLTGDDCCLVPVYNVIFCVDVVCDRRFVLLKNKCIYISQDALVSSEQIRFSTRLKQSVLTAESRVKSGRDFQTVGPVIEKPRRPLSVESETRMRVDDG